MTEQNSNEQWSGEMDKAEHEHTYDAFISYTKWGTIGVVVILLLLLVFVY